MELVNTPSVKPSCVGTGICSPVPPSIVANRPASAPYMRPLMRSRDPVAAKAHDLLVVLPWVVVALTVVGPLIAVTAAAVLAIVGGLGYRRRDDTAPDPGPTLL